MLKSKTSIFTLFFSALAIIISGVIVISCTSNEEVPMSNNSTAEEIAIDNDTIYVETEAPIIQKSTIGAVSDKSQNVLKSLNVSQTRSTSDNEVFYLYDETTEKYAYAISNPSNSKEWLFECYGSNTKEPIIILFEQVDSNQFVTKDEKGNILRYFTYDPEKRELWTYNRPTTRGMSTQDKILCNSMFAAANILVCEALAVPTGGASLLVGLGFAVASTYVCD